MKNQYSISEISKNIISLGFTKLFYKKARLIRRPFYIRGKSSLLISNGFTTGYSCRFDLPGNNIKTLTIGENCQMGDYVHIVAHEKVVIGKNCLMASKIFISDTSHGSYSGLNQSHVETAPKLRELKTNPIIIGDNVWIGENVCILPGVTIGDGCIIGANSVVTKSISDNNIVAGTPAKVIKTYNSTSKTWDRKLF